MLSKTTSRAAAVCRQLMVLLFILVTLFFLNKKSFAQDKTVPDTRGQKSNEHRKPAEPKQPDTPRAFVWGNTIGSTKEGTSDELMNEYKTLVNKYLEIDTNGRKNISRDIEPADRKRMETIAKQMNKEQQSKQEVMFVKPFPPSPKTVPTQKQLDAFENANVYGVWIDGKKRNNNVLNDYTNTDFSHYSVSKLYGAAKKGRSYTHQVDLMTKPYYQNYYDEAMSHMNESILVVMQVFPPPKK